eukprot:2970314-Lingulodinium_polyedra.AAC.1
MVRSGRTSATTSFHARAMEKHISCVTPRLLCLQLVARGLRRLLGCRRRGNLGLPNWARRKNVETTTECRASPAEA